MSPNEITDIVTAWGIAITAIVVTVAGVMLKVVPVIINARDQIKELWTAHRTTSARLDDHAGIIAATPSVAVTVNENAGTPQSAPP